MDTAGLAKKRRARTDEELEALPRDGYKYELLDGELITSPAHARHGCRVLSPSDRLQQIYRKLDRYFEHGLRLVWWLDWAKEQVHIYTPDSVNALTRPNDVLSGEDVLPGFKCRLSRIFS